MITVHMMTPQGLYRTVETDILNVDSTDGRRGILTNHVPIVLMLRVGSIATNENGVRKNYTVSGGMVYFEDNEARVLSSAIEDYDEIDVARALSAKERAERRLKEHKDDLDIARAQVALARALNRLHAKGM
ncbi:MAG: ATP synthase F1 subunit epsilon [Erysipelotrichaceae bacterium]|nr:ATP synthase F1 subunit epsilon [Erysipelotrichaceae bacterium]